MKNSANVKYKKSKIESTTNKEIVIVFTLQVFLCVIGALYGATWMRINAKDAPYLGFDLNDAWSTNWFLLFIKTTGTWILIFT